MIIDREVENKDIEFDNPDDLFQAFQTRIPILPYDASRWTFCPATMFHDALPDPVQTYMYQDGFTFPDPKQLPTKAQQISCLRDVRTAACKAFAKFTSERENFKLFIQSNLPNQAQSSPSRSPARKVPKVQFAADTKTSNSTTAQSFATRTSFKSPAEQTLSRYKSEFLSANGHPMNPFTNYTSKFPAHFNGCLYCGPNTPDGHTEFKRCPHRNNEQAKAQFYNELHAHNKKSRDNFYLIMMKRPVPDNYTPPPSV